MTMTKKKPRKPRKKVIRRPDAPKARRYVPKECNSCTALRPKNKSYSEVYSTFKRTDGTYRYCRCNFCNNTWMSVERNE